LQSKITFDLHTHTIYSHGKGGIMDNAKAAYEAGLKTLGIADHGPGHMNYGIDMARLDEMRRDIDAARKEFPELEILLGVEANIVNYSGHLDVSRDDQKLFDYIIAGYHYGYFGENFAHGLNTCVKGWLHDHGIKSGAGTRQKNTEVVIAALENNNIKILTHPGDKMAVNIDAIAKCCERRGTLMEINTHHKHLNTAEITDVQKYNINFVLSSDAHRPERVGQIDEALQRALDAKLDLNRIVNYRG